MKKTPKVSTKTKIPTAAAKAKIAKADDIWKDVDNFENPNGKITFLKHSRRSRTATMAETPLALFHLTFPQKIVEILIRQTNHYHVQAVAKGSEETKLPWNDVVIEEMYAFLGIVIAMGIIILPEIRDYWCKSSILNLPWFSSVLSRNRFDQILCNLYLADNDLQPPRDDPNYKLYKLGTLPDILTRVYETHLKHKKELSIDKQMIGTKARALFIQYMLKKPKTFGVKLWPLCEVSLGYCFKFQIYKGKQKDTIEKGLGKRVVFDLMQGYFQKQHQLYVDNFCTSPQLLNTLEGKQTHACGTIRYDRGQFSPSFTKSKLKRVEKIYLWSNNLLAVHWYDKRDVFVLSNMHSTGSVEIQQHADKNPILKTYHDRSIQIFHWRC